MARKRTFDDSMTYWFPWKRPMARLRGIEFLSHATKNGLVGSALRVLPLGPKFGLSPSGLAIRLFRRFSMKTQPKCRLGPASFAFRASQMPRPPLFRLFNVCITVSDVPRLTQTTLSVYSIAPDYTNCVFQKQILSSNTVKLKKQNAKLLILVH